jgi:hypothetical protein
MRQKSDVRKREEKLHELEKTRMRIDAQLAQAAAQLARAEAALAEAEQLEARALLGDAEAKDAKRVREQAVDALEEARRQKRTVEVARVELDRRIAEAEQALAGAQRETAAAADRDETGLRRQPGWRSPRR